MRPAFVPSSLASGIASNVCLRTFSSPFNLRPASRHRTCGNHHTIRMAQDPTTPAPPWHAAFPAPQHTAPAISREEVMPSLSSPDLLLVDVRRTDYEGGTIKGSINLPAQSFYMNRGVLHDLCKRAGVKKVVFYCGSSNGRGPRCSGWFVDYLADKEDESIQSLTLIGGIKGWVKAGDEYVRNVDGYEAKVWEESGDAQK